MSEKVNGFRTAIFSFELTGMSSSSLSIVSSVSGADAEHGSDDGPAGGGAEKEDEEGLEGENDSHSMESK